MTIFLGLAVRTPQLAPVPHVHLCPMCYEVKACSAKCSEEPDQTDMHGQPAGSVVDCDDCRAEPTPGTVRVELTREVAEDYANHKFAAVMKVREAVKAALADAKGGK